MFNDLLNLYLLLKLTDSFPISSEEATPAFLVENKEQVVLKPYLKRALLSEVCEVNKVQKTVFL